METVRAFIAVDIGNEIRAQLDELQRTLKKVHANVRWMRPGNIHLTLVFLGDVPLEEIDAAGKALDRACRGTEAFAMKAFGAGFFGKPRHPRVIWAGVADCPPLSGLQNRIVQELHSAGIGFDSKAFAPHLTLGRFREIDHHTGPLLDKLEKKSEADLGSVRIDRVELIQSTLTPRGPEYEVLHCARLME